MMAARLLTTSVANTALQAEQADVEAYYINNGYMLPNFHKAYWLGLSADGAIVASATGKNDKPVPRMVSWQWMDGKVFSKFTYQHWGWWVAAGRSTATWSQLARTSCEAGCWITACKCVPCMAVLVHAAPWCCTLPKALQVH